MNIRRAHRIDCRSVDDLSRRSKKLLKKLGGINFLLEHYASHGHFRDFKNVGAKSNLELTSLARHLVDVRSGNQLELEKPILPSLERLHFYYHNLKRSLSVRAKNNLDWLERNFYELYEVESLSESFFRIVINTHFDFTQIPNCGTKSALELRKFFNKVYLDGTSEDNVALPIPKVSYDLQQGLIDSAAFLKIDLDSNNVIVNGQFDLLKLATFFLLTARQGNKRQELIQKVYFTDFANELEIKLIAKQVGYSDQNVRNILRQVEDVKIPLLVQYVFNQFKKEEIFFSLSEIRNFSSIPKLDFFEIGPLSVRPNSRLVVAVAKAFHKQQVFSLDDQDYGLPANSVCFNKECDLLIHKNFAELIELRKLIEFLELEIINLASLDYDYNLEVLIGRFYSEFQIEIDSDSLAEVKILAKKLIKDDISIDPSTIRRIKKRQLRTGIVNEIIYFLDNQPGAVRTKLIEAHLLNDGFEIDRGTLLRILNMHKDLFSMQGSGYWKSRTSGDSYQGSIRQIVENYLTDKHEPAHISKIIKLLSEYRDTNERSIITNLKLDESSRFYFFKCRYIGLSDKKYDTYWYNLPEVAGGKFNWKHFFKKFKSDSAIIDYVVQTLNVPQEHAQYLLEKNKAKKGQL